MKAADKHFKCINSQTGYVLFYHSLDNKLSDKDAKAELEKIRAQVAINNGLYLETLYWEEMKEDPEVTK